MHRSGLITFLAFAGTVGSSLPGRAADESNGQPPRVESTALGSNVHVNALGLLVFGLTGSVELGSDHWAGAARLRWVDSGLYARSVLSTDNQSPAFSYGAGLGARYYSATTSALTGWFAGPVAEIIHTRVQDASVAKIATVTTLLVPQIEGGYRWRYRSLLFDVGAGIGYALVLTKGVEDIAGGHNASSYSNSASNKPYGSLIGDIGFFF